MKWYDLSDRESGGLVLGRFDDPQWIKQIQQLVPKYRRIALKPQQVCLAVVDMQLFFCNQNSHAFVQAAPDIIPNINTLINAFSRAERPIFATYYAATPDEAPAMAAFWRHLLPPDDPATQIDPRIKLPQNASVFCKPTYSAFVGTEFGEAVLATGVEQVVVCGVMTHLCVETAAREFFCRGVVPFIPADATATINKDIHIASLRAAAHGFAIVTTTAKILNAFGVSAD